MDPLCSAFLEFQIWIIPLIIGAGISKHMWFIWKLPQERAFPKDKLIYSFLNNGYWLGIWNNFKNFICFYSNYKKIFCLLIKIIILFQFFLKISLERLSSHVFRNCIQWYLYCRNKLSRFACIFWQISRLYDLRVLCYRRVLRRCLCALFVLYYRLV